MCEMWKIYLSNTWLKVCSVNPSFQLNSCSTFSVETGISLHQQEGYTIVLLRQISRQGKSRENIKICTGPRPFSVPVVVKVREVEKIDRAETILTILFQLRKVCLIYQQEKEYLINTKYRHNKKSTNCFHSNALSWSNMFII